MHPRHYVRHFALAIALAGAGAAAASDSDILAAKEAAQKGQARALEVLRERLSGHALAAYPAYWLLSLQLEKSDPGEIRAFLARHADSPLAEQLRREWLKVLGASRAWEAFREEHPKLRGDDAEVACFALQARMARADPEVHAEARALFVAGREAPGACETVFAALVADRRVTHEEHWDRIRKLLAGGHLRDAKRMNALLPPEARMNEKALERAHADPAKWLAAEKAVPATRAARALAAFAIVRLARTKPEDAAERLVAMAAALGEQETRFAWTQVAHQAALQHHPRALEWYALARDTRLTDAQAAWKARAGLRARDWKTVLAAIQLLPPEEAREAGWRYWRACALRELGEAEAARSLLHGIAKETGFHALLAADELGVAHTPKWESWRPEAADLDRVRSLPGIERALILYRVGLDNEALREWLWATKSLGDRELLAAAEVARLANVPDRAINTANRTVQLHDFTQRYPTPHREALAAAARQWDLDEALVYAIIRQESRFMPHARSRVGATGLMQLMPSTARWVAAQIPIQPFSTAMLTRPELNVQMGSYYLRRVLTDLGDPILATAGYNAGPGRARRWRDERPLEGAIYIETIPFNETRDYVKQVMSNLYFYSHRLRGVAPRMRELLGVVPGRGGGALPEAAVAATVP